MAEISVVMPVHNAGRYLQAAVDSILHQSFDDLELLLVDDRSDDGAMENLSGLDSRVRVLNSSGAGVVAAFNTGWQASTSPYIARMDADDVSLTNRLQVQYRYLKEHPDIQLAGCRVELFSRQGIADGNRHYQRWLNDQVTPEQIHKAIFVESPMPNPGTLFRATALKQLGGYSDPPWPEDYDLYLRADRMGMRMGKPEQVLLRWRDHSMRLTRTDGRYSIRAFQQAKAHYLVHGRDVRSGILIWGAGNTGRDLHDCLAREGAQITGFVDVHPRRIGGNKRGLPVWPIERAASWERGMILVAVGARGARRKIRQYLTQAGKTEGEAFLFTA